MTRPATTLIASMTAMLVACAPAAARLDSGPVVSADDVDRDPSAAATHEERPGGSPTAATAQLGRAHARLGAGDHAGAVRIYRNILEDDPQNAQAAKELGQVVREFYSREEALEVLDDVVKSAAGNPYVQYFYGATLAMLERPEDALAAYRLSAALGLRDAVTMSEIGAVLFQLNRNEEAVAALEEAISLGSTDPNTFNNLGWTLVQLGRHADAVPRLREAVRLDSLHWRALGNLGAALAVLARYDEAEPPLRESIRLNPDMAYTQFNLAGVLLELGRPEEALKPIREALRLQPDNQQFRAGLERIMAAVRTS